MSEHDDCKIMRAWQNGVAMNRFDQMTPIEKLDHCARCIARLRRLEAVAEAVKR